MPPRQIWMFKFGCWSTIAAAVIQLAVHVAGQRAPINDAERRLFDLASSHYFTMADGRLRTLMDRLDGLSLDVAALLAVMGTLGLIVVRRGSVDVRLMSGVARACALTSVVLLLVAVIKFSIVAALPMAVMATCFLVASVEAPTTSA